MPDLLPVGLQDVLHGRKPALRKNRKIAVVHLFTGLGMHIALDVGSGAVHVLSPDAYALLSGVTEQGLPMTAQPPFPGADAEAWSSLYALYEGGMLFAPDRAASITPPAETPLKAICLHVAHDCNLRCGYCFAETGGFGADRSLMDAHTAKKAIDYLVSRSGNRRGLEVDFFGGEPLMALDTVKAAVAYARGLQARTGKYFRFTLTTNGVLLDDATADYLNAEMSNVVLSLDGRREVNDAARRTLTGGGCYDLIVPKLTRFARGRAGDWFVRGTFTARNLDFCEDVLHLDALGLRNISIEPAVLPGGHPLALNERHLPAILAEYERLAQVMAERDDCFTFFHFNVDLDNGPCVYKRLRGCGAGFEYAAVTPGGGVYPCHQFAGKPEFKMGSVHDGSFDADISRRFSGAHVNSRAACAGCWAKYFCSGGCHAANLNTSGGTDAPYEIGCVLERKRLECAIALLAARSAKCTKHTAT